MSDGPRDDHRTSGNRKETTAELVHFHVGGRRKDLSGRSWSEYPVLPLPPHEADTGEHPELRGRRFVEVPESGWHALVAWAIGPEHAVRCPERRTPSPVHVTCESRGRRVQRWEERTRTDRAGVDRDIDDFLTEAGAPHQPCGYRWFAELPEGFRDGDHLFGSFSSHLASVGSDERDPPRMRGAMRNLARRLYGDAGRSAFPDPPGGP
ncbi:DUF5956 family protein [Nocardiopsis sp. HUAS JQ3]|uniref:DUF5956 family protein n=1 Tax=Nocardiopsis sp. HUAS JQ3 TaxID=3061629 RepID=UPI0023A9643C|nr:DUF5956 family protein [Nocardiopsis sp. HUAS JQ3]WDZ91858.1 DUF5956 family protein [Nocardiopsis sp. HUAS JQ3]